MIASGCAATSMVNSRSQGFCVRDFPLLSLALHLEDGHAELISRERGVASAPELFGGHVDVAVVAERARRATLT